MKTHSFPQRIRLCRLCGLAVVLAPLAAVAQTSAGDTAPPPRHVHPGAVELKRHDRAFFEKAAKATMAQIEISRVAVARTTNPEVKRFAQALIDDHQAASEELAALAASKGVSLPAKEADANRWEKRNAKSFDRDYLDKMVSDHEDVVKLFERQAKDGDDPDAVAFARKHLPKWQRHLYAAHDLKRAFK